MSVVIFFFPDDSGNKLIKIEKDPIKIYVYKSLEILKSFNIMSEIFELPNRVIRLVKV